MLMHSDFIPHQNYYTKILFTNNRVSKTNQITFMHVFPSCACFLYFNNWSYRPIGILDS
jgi:hypothetical protein